jgi:hypothetical protein
MFLHVEGKWNIFATSYFFISGPAINPENIPTPNVPGLSPIAP